MNRMWTAKSIAYCLVAVGLVWSLSACSGSSPSPDPMPTGHTYSGLWFSPQYEHMYLRHEGDRVMGVFTHRHGGTIEGTVQGNLLIFEWNQPGDRRAARRDMNGQGYFHLVVRDGEAHLVGEWGYGEDQSGAPWHAEFIRDIEYHDPRRLEDLEGRR